MIIHQLDRRRIVGLKLEKELEAPEFTGDRIRWGFQALVKSLGT